MISRRLRSSAVGSGTTTSTSGLSVLSIGSLKWSELRDFLAYKGGYGERTSKLRRAASSGYFVSSREKFLRAFSGEMFGYADGYRPISAQRFIFLASKCSRICGRACNSIFLRRNSHSALFVTGLGSQFLQQKWQFRVPSEM
jgi:hypothetical protein